MEQNFILLGLLTAASWGIGDFIASRSTKKSNAKNTMFWVSLCATVFWLTFASATSQLLVPDALSAFIAFGVGGCFYAGDFLFNRASKDGKVAVASPLLALGGVFTIAMAVVFLAETPTLWQMVFGMLAVMGGVLIGLKDVALRQLEKNALIMLPAAFMHGIGLTLTKPLVERIGVVNAAVWEFTTVSIVFMALCVLKWRPSIQRPRWENLVGPVLYFIGFFSFATAVSTNLVALTAPIAELFPLFTVGLAVMLGHETLQKHQWIGLGLAVAGLVGLSV